MQRAREKKNYLEGVDKAYEDGKAAEERNCDATIKQRREAVMAKFAQIWAAHDKEVEQLKTSSKTLRSRVALNSFAFTRSNAS